MMPAPAATRVLTGEAKAAVLLLSLGEELSASLIHNLSKDQLRRMSHAISTLGVVSRDDVDGVLAETLDLVRQRAGELRSDAPYARRVLSNAFGADTATDLLGDVEEPEARPANLEQLEKADPKKLIRFLASEHPQTVALILAQMKRNRAAALLGALPEAMRVEVTVRLAGLQNIPVEVVDRLVAELGKKLGSGEKEKKAPFRGSKAVADLMNELDPEIAEQLLAAIGESDDELSNEIRDSMFTFDDMIKLDLAALKEVLSRVDRKILTLALKGTDDHLKKHVLKTMSQRGGAMMLEDMEAMGPVKIKEIEAAQRQIITIIRNLDREGVISLRGGEQDYVV